MSELANRESAQHLYTGVLQSSPTVSHSVSRRNKRKQRLQVIKRQLEHLGGEGTSAERSSTSETSTTQEQEQTVRRQSTKAVNGQRSEEEGRVQQKRRKTAKRKNQTT